MTACTIPPEGWSCTRAAGHDGPCAAVQVSQKPVVPSHWNGFGKYGASLSFEGGILNVNVAGHGDKDGDGNFVFAEFDLEWEASDETGKDYRWINIPNSELLAIRDKLNELFPPEPTTSLDVSGVLEEVRAAWAEMKPMLQRRNHGWIITSVLPMDNAWMRLDRALSALNSSPYGREGE